MGRILELNATVENVNGPDIFGVSPETYRTFVDRCGGLLVPYVERYYKRKQYTQKEPKRK